jgi:hypothetical protein
VVIIATKGGRSITKIINVGRQKKIPKATKSSKLLNLVRRQDCLASGISFEGKIALGGTPVAFPPNSRLPWVVGKLFVFPHGLT